MMILRAVCSLILVLVLVTSLQAENFGLGGASVTQNTPTNPMGSQNTDASAFFMAGTLGQQLCTDLNGDGICDQTGVRLSTTRITQRQAILPRRTITRAVTKQQNFALGAPATSERVIKQTVEVTKWVPQKKIVERAVTAAPPAPVVAVPLCVISESLCPSGMHIRTYLSDGSYTIRSTQTTSTMHHQSMGPEIHHGQRNAQGEVMYGSNEVNRLLRFRPILRRRLARMGQNEW
jgi:hypothetical protein